MTSIFGSNGDSNVSFISNTSNFDNVINRLDNDYYTKNNLSDGSTSLKVNNLISSSTVESSATNSGAITVSGGLGVAKSIYAKDIVCNTLTASTEYITTSLEVKDNMTTWSYGNAGDSIDSGIQFENTTGGNVSHSALVRDATDKKFKFIDTTTSTISEITDLDTLPQAGVQCGSLLIKNTTQSTNTLTGALICSGGVSIQKQVNIGGVLKILDSTITTTTDTGCVVLNGGLGIAGGFNAGGNCYILGRNVVQSTLDSTSYNTGSLLCNGGVGVSKNLYVAGNVVAVNTTQSTDTLTGALICSGGVGIAKNLYVAGKLNNITVPNKSDTLACLSDISDNNYWNNWQKISGYSSIPPKTWNYVCCSENSEYILACASDSLYMSSNMGKSFTQVTPSGAGGSVNWLCARITPNAEFMFIVNSNTDTNNFYQSSDKGTTWVKVDISGTPVKALDSSDDGKYVYVCKQDTVYRSTNYGMSFSSFKTLGGVGNMGSVHVSSEGKYVLIVNYANPFGDSYYYDNYCDSDSPKYTADVSSECYWTGFMCKSGRVFSVFSNNFGAYRTSIDYGNTISASYILPPSTGYTQGSYCCSYNCETMSNIDRYIRLYPAKEYQYSSPSLKSIYSNLSGNILIGVSTSNELLMSKYNLSPNPSLGSSIYSLLQSTSSNLGALIVSGGVGIGKNLNVGGDTKILTTTQSSDTLTGALICSGGVGIAKNTNIGGLLHIYNTENATNTASGCAIFEGGVLINKAIYVRGDRTITGTSILLNTTDSTSVGSGSTIISGGLGIAKNINTGGIIKIFNTTSATDTLTGSLICSGGASIAKRLYCDSIYLSTTGGTPSALSYYEEISFTSTLEGAFTSYNPYVYIHASRIGNMILLSFSQSIGAGSPYIELTITDYLPARFCPSSESEPAVTVYSGGDSIIGSVLIATNGKMMFFKNDGTNFSGTYGIKGGGVTYCINQT
jgi:hypothetical protein